MDKDAEIPRAAKRKETGITNFEVKGSKMMTFVEASLHDATKAYTEQTRSKNVTDA